MNSREFRNELYTNSTESAWSSLGLNFDFELNCSISERHDLIWLYLRESCAVCSVRYGVSFEFVKVSFRLWKLVFYSSVCSRFCLILFAANLKFILGVRKSLIRWRNFKSELNPGELRKNSKESEFMTEFKWFRETSTKCVGVREVQTNSWSLQTQDESCINSKTQTNPNQFRQT